MATYETEEIADKAKEVVERFFEMEAEHIHDVFAFHGKVLSDGAGAIME